MPDWPWIGSFLDLCAVYLTTQLVRCAAFSLILTELVMLLRKMLFSERIFLQGMLWTVFLVTPFLGKRLRLWRLVAGMGKVFFDGIRISVTDMIVTPFTIGLLKPKIVLPKAMADSYSREELKAIIQHEQTHIRLGHLLFGLAWDILRCLLWINPFLTVFQKHFRADMEDICDRVCIQNSGKTAHEYGMVLLKTLKLLRSESEAAPPAVTYAGESEFTDMKRQMGKIAGFRPYRKNCACAWQQLW